MDIVLDDAGQSNCLKTDFGAANRAAC
jgi:hypothetical protein